MKYLILLISSPLYARSIKATVDNIGRVTAQLGVGLALVGIIVGGIMLSLGKQDAAVKITSGILGLLVVVMSSDIVSFVKGVA